MAKQMAGKKLDQVDTPCIVVDLDRVKVNCERMTDRCKAFGVTLRPMMKTHKTVEAADLMTSGSRRCIECSTLKECEFYADHDYDDILWTGIFTEDKIPRLVALKERLSVFHVMLDDIYGVRLLSKYPQPCPWSAFMMVNVGGDRSGVMWDGDKAVQIARAMQRSPDVVTLQGLYGHEGNVYVSCNPKQIQQMSDVSAERILALATRLRAEGITVPSVGLGATPSCSKPGQKMKDIDEFHPGNYCFYDAQQVSIGSCDWADVACRLATRVTGHYPESGQMLVDAGFLAVSKDGQGAFGDRGSYCLIDGHPELKLVNMNQEVGFVQAVGSASLEYEKYPIGSLLYLIPWHSCATACAHTKFLVHQGDDIVAEWSNCIGW